MSIKKEKIPIVRFRDFSEPWIKNQLSEIAEFSKGRGYSKKDLQSHGTPIILYGRLYTNYESEISNVETYANLEENSVVSEGGEVIIPASGESADDISRASCVIDRGIILGGDLNIVRPREYLNSLFIAITLSNGSQQRELSKRAQGKSVVHLHNSDLKAVKLFYPSYEEQSAIGSLFRTLDDLLASYKDNLANYQSLKATMLSKMFPKAGKTIPEIRLERFEGEWEEKCIGEIADIVRGASPRPIQDPKWFDSNSEIGWLRISDVTSQNGRIHSLEQKISKLGQEKTRVLTEPHLLLSIAATVGKPVVNYVKTGVHDGFLIFMNPKFDREFMFQWLEMFREKWNRYGQPGSQVNLNSDIVKNQKILIPCMEEQKAIGAYFSNLDNLIVAHQEKISQLETLKKKLLQDMFI
ncbi:Type I restriction-modification system, specificity subunit S [Streptococcus thermophilus]|uniref:Type I restriction-modification system, specificity subunit S n=2 Tax=Streptococcus thermophilus TaxID=1308 RepID=A0A8D6UAI3_STRTR|nr:restriction endonuclease subunit S [Streptococcus thermophilus]CAD0142757.1 Type I restriction-modification system, specificity subunit S [Streptococcus thermophilus]CAD0144507.1 Type I restriction-modification system, specificity subunit S [Streptococcus thermophilus]CAD0152100.1 Type I restriction-modification system, specificity subunit S [Streptococcus thermophilus]